MKTLLSEIRLPIEQELQQFKSLFETELQTDSPILEEVLKYIRQKQGKMMRPVLFFLISKAFGKTTSATYHAALSIELLHTASLIHDDVVDESDKRRGQASVNAIYNNKVSVLSGDYLLALALEQSVQTNNLAIVQKVSKLGQVLAQGELLQLSSVAGKLINEETYLEIIYKKTAALFSACSETAAISANSKPEDIEKARLFGEYLGLCFQIKDDIFDFFDCKEIGKPTGNDLKEGKLTLPVIYVINNVGQKEAETLAYKVKEGSASEEEISNLIELTKKNGGIEYATSVMLSYKKKAAELLCSLPESEIKTALHLYLDLIVKREN
ncbi:MAG: polyprenyl synthetase family protein [Bacteroidales bacterium]|nr:polyprenyl synthetase family protein [Bacteroidales bacterium]MDD4821129.1 polyprenyl synthetase family protein [Bacteroidales bacterium]